MIKLDLDKISTFCSKFFIQQLTRQQIAPQHLAAGAIGHPSFLCAYLIFTITFRESILSIGKIQVLNYEFSKYPLYTKNLLGINWVPSTLPLCQSFIVCIPRLNIKPILLWLSLKLKIIQVKLKLLEHWRIETNTLILKVTVLVSDKW